MINLKKIRQGSHNILINCANLSKLDSLLIISEDQKLGWYNKDVSEAVFEESKKLGIKTNIMEVGAPENNSKIKLKDMINKYDCTIFFARLGDQDRFENKSFKSKRVMSYVRNMDSLTSSFGCTNHLAMVEIKNIINTLILDAEFIEITCPLGTKVSGKINKKHSLLNSEVSVLRFPLVVPAPISATHFSGKVVLSNYLTPTGSKVYEPNSLKLDEPIYVNLENGKINKFLGNFNTVKKVENHYKYISELFNIDQSIVHSCHAGIHPGIKYNHPISKNPDLWSNTMFASPSYLHFHTCGNYAPGEICWMILNHTVTIDGKAIWEKGRLKVESFKETLNCINKWKDLKKLYENL